MNNELFAFINEYCQYGWRGINKSKFYIWIPKYCIADFIDLIDFSIFEYEFIDGCALSKNDLCVELGYFVYDLVKWFPKENK